MCVSSLWAGVVGGGAGYGVVGRQDMKGEGRNKGKHGGAVGPRYVNSAL